ncbi:MAG: phospholipid carrier-dependent glycosyltransferase [Clostridia bacterium]|nr:phospholipid carrier-dependent glycosyltransferase [Clostridia bacterium]
MQTENLPRFPKDGEEKPLEKEPKPNKKVVLRKCLREAGLYALVFVVTLALFILLKPRLKTQYPGAVAQSFIAIGLAAVLIFGAYMGITKRLTTSRIILLLFIFGCILRIGYMLYTPVSARQQDTYNSKGTGHEGYAWTIFSTGKLPTSNAYQFYHPPLNAFIQSTFMKFMEFFTELLTKVFGMGNYFPSKFLNGMEASSVNKDFVTAERYYLYSTTQILSVLYSVMTCVVLLKTVKLFHFSKKMEILLSAFVIFFPRHIQFAGMVNNDALAYLLSMTAIYYALKWQKGDKSSVYIWLCALAVGLGMMTKLSSATVCLPIGGIFLYELIGTARKAKGATSWKKLFLQYGVFLAICAPIGLWFQVYAKERFDQEFGFVFSNLNLLLSTKRHSFFERFFVAFDINEYFGSLYCVPFSSWADKANQIYGANGHYNLFNYITRSAIFGEFTYWRGEGFAVVSLLLAWISCFALFMGMIRAIVLYVRKRKAGGDLLKDAKINGADLFFIFLLLLSQAGSEVYFYITMPYACTMDFRYIMPIILGLALAVGCTHKILATDKGETSLAIDRAMLLSVSAFLIFSTLFYCVCI